MYQENLIQNKRLNCFVNCQFADFLNIRYVQIMQALLMVRSWPRFPSSGVASMLYNHKVAALIYRLCKVRSVFSIFAHLVQVFPRAHHNGRRDDLPIA